jgi:hypothetical protein
MNYIDKQIGLKKDEKIEFIIRSSLFGFWFQLFLFFLILMICCVFSVLLVQRGFWGMTILLIVSLFAVFQIIRLFWIWYYNVCVVTNKRIIDIDRKGLFDKVISEADLSQIEDISVRQKGLLQNIFNYATILIQLDQGALIIELKNIKSPRETVENIRNTISLNVLKRDINAQTVIKLLNFANLTDEQIMLIIEKIIDNTSEERFINIISQFIQIEEDQ